MAYQYLRASKEMRVYDSNENTLAKCPDARSFDRVIASDLILLAVPISTVEAVCRDMASLLKPGQLVVDTCSVKEKPVRMMLAELPEYVQILGTHPLFGPDSGKKGIAGLKITLCP